MTNYLISVPVSSTIQTMTKTVAMIVAPKGGQGSTRPASGQMYPRGKNN